MRTLYLRNVPDVVVERLERLAARDGMSVSAVAIRELDEGTRWLDNAALLADLPDLGLSLTGAEIAKEIEEMREERAEAIERATAVRRGERDRR